MAHHFAQAVVEYSGLEHGSLGEYLFPADLSFLVYRRGMTPDLGNLSAMWRNYGRIVLDHLAFGSRSEMRFRQFMRSAGRRVSCLHYGARSCMPGRKQSFKPLRAWRWTTTRLGFRPAGSRRIFSHAEFRRTDCMKLKVLPARGLASRSCRSVSSVLRRRNADASDKVGSF